MIIYQITNTITGDFYIGKTTKTLDERFRQHRNNRNHFKTYLYHAMIKYGIENFTIKPLTECFDETFLNQMEKDFIKKLNPKYNMTAGGDGGDTSKSPNYIKAMKRRDTTGSKNPMFGKKRTDTSKYLAASKDKMITANRCPVSCEGIVYPSRGDAEAALGFSIHNRLDNPRHPTYFRLRERTKRK